MELFDLRLWKGFECASENSIGPSIVDQISIDSRKIDSPNSLFVALEGNFHDGHQFVSHAAKAGAKFALVKKDFHPAEDCGSVILLRVENPLQAFQEIASAYRKFLNVEIVCIAGSYGKTMVKDLLHSLIGSKINVVSSPESFNSQIGVPLSLLRIKKEHEIAIIEASISKKDEMDVLSEIISPSYAILTHIGKKHVATLGSLNNTAAEIMKILINVPSTGWTVMPNDPLINEHLKKMHSTKHFWNEQSHNLPHAKFLSSTLTEKMPYKIDFPNGKQFLSFSNSGFYYFIDLINIAVKAAWLFGIPSEDICEILKSYIPEPMRTEIWRSAIGTTFINDVYCSDPQSVDKALKYFIDSPAESRKIFIFGGLRGKIPNPERDFKRIGAAIQRSGVDLLLLVGNHPFEMLTTELTKHSSHTEILRYETYAVALKELRAQIKHNDTVLIKGEKKELLDTITEAFNDSICNNQCIINLAAIQTNIQIIRKKLPPGNRIMAVVKALAYGTDDVRIAKFLASCGIEILGVSYVDEGVALKRAKVTQSIFVINAAVYEAYKVVKWDLEVGVSEKKLIHALSLEAVDQNKKIKVHLHVDTGMSRFGCRPEEALDLVLLIRELPNLELIGIMTHFACSDNPDDDEFTKNQAKIFEDIITQIENHGIAIPWKHAANSSGAIRFDFPKFNMVRIGLAIYGLYSSPASKEALELRLALSLISRIVGINICKEGETISYGRSYKVAKEKQSIAVLPIGYFDGLHRNYSGKGNVIIRGQKAPMVGKICMDFMMVDVTEIPNVSIGDSVLIFGEDEYGHYLSPEDLAIKGDSIVYELITCLGPRIQRIFVHEETHESGNKNLSYIPI
jgi:Alr-MurF fusion protein